MTTVKTINIIFFIMELSIIYLGMHWYTKVYKVFS